jgi:hypothetical protein
VDATTPGLVVPTTAMDVDRRAVIAAWPMTARVTIPPADGAGARDELVAVDRSVADPALVADGAVDATMAGRMDPSPPAVTAAGVVAELVPVIGPSVPEPDDAGVGPCELEIAVMAVLPAALVVAGTPGACARPAATI